MARSDAQDDAIAWLAPLLVDDEELEALLAARPRRRDRRRSPPSRARRSPRRRRRSPKGAPDLDSISLRATPSPRRSTRLTPLELAAWYAHEAHTDAPEAVSPVLATFVRFWAAGLDDNDRQRLKDFAVRMVGTNGDVDADRRRRWRAADWLVRVQAVSWLRAAGLGDAAERLAAVGPLSDETELARAVDLLGAAITTAGRRIDITASIVSEGASGTASTTRAWRGRRGRRRATSPGGWRRRRRPPRAARTRSPTPPTCG